jgi:hypothetical protein
VPSPGLLPLPHNEVSEELNFESVVPDAPVLNDITCDLNIDSPTIRHIANIDDAALLRQIDDRTFLECSNIMNSPETTEHVASVFPTLTHLETNQVALQDTAIYRGNTAQSPISNMDSVKTTASETPESSNVTVLSNVKFDWQNYKFCVKKPQKFCQAGQEEFIKFISNPISSEENFFTKTEKETDNMGNKAVETLQDSDSKENIPNQCQGHKVGDWVIVQYKIKANVYAYIGKIHDCPDNASYTIHFLNKSSTKTDTFTWPTVIDEDTVPESRILSALQIPVLNRRGQYCFKKLPKLKYK